MAGEKTEAPTPRRREEARKKGQVARSTEVTSTLVLFAGLAVIGSMGGGVAEQLLGIFRSAFLQVGRRDANAPELLGLAGSMVGQAFLACGPLFLAAAVVGAASNILQVGLVVSLRPLAPDFSRVSPITGLRRLWSTQSMVEVMKALFKLAVTGFIAWRVIQEQSATLIGLQYTSAAGSLAAVGSLVLELAQKCGLALFVLAAADYLYNRRMHEGSLKMSRDELKEEMRHSEGDPHLKGKLRQMARQLASRRMMQKVPTADVVVTNPTHFAVALEYHPSQMRAPVVTAKGQLLVAERIKRIAQEHGVPIVENPPLARALFRSVEIGDAIPTTLYEAVAEVLAFIYRVRDRRGSRAVEPGQPQLRRPT